MYKQKVRVNKNNKTTDIGREPNLVYTFNPFGLLNCPNQYVPIYITKATSFLLLTCMWWSPCYRNNPRNRLITNKLLMKNSLENKYLAKIV